VLERGADGAAALLLVPTFIFAPDLIALSEQ
jgi:hypothetical protein